MQAYLDHFRALSRKIDAERVAWNAQGAALTDRINDASAAVAHAEHEGRYDSKARADLRSLKQERANLKAPSFIDPLSEVEAYARTHPNAAAAEPVAVKVPSGQTPLAVHNNQTEKTNALLAEIGRVNAAPAAAEDIHAKLTAQIDALACPPRIVNGNLVLPRHVVDSNGTALTLINAEGLFAWLMHDRLVAAVHKLAASDGPGLTAQERRTALANLYEKFTAALRLEAAAAMAAEVAGQRVIRRRHVHPAVLLGLQIEPAAVYAWFAAKKGA